MVNQFENSVKMNGRSRSDSRKSSTIESKPFKRDSVINNLLDFEDILAQVGDYGWYQKRLVYLFLIPTTTILPMISMATLFMISTPDHWCYVPELANLSRAEQAKLIRPPIIKQGLEDYDSCKVFDIDYATLAASYKENTSQPLFQSSNGSVTYNGLTDRENIPVKECPNGWTFDNTYYDETATTAMNLVCDRASLSSWILTVDGVSKVLGTVFFGLISDK